MMDRRIRYFRLISYWKRLRLAIVRHGEYNSLPVLAPFYGRWDIYQGFNGPHTHQPPWQHALDFYITEQGRSYRADGAALADYYCFGLPVLSPVAGYVVKTLDSLPDNPPGQVDIDNNWGNHVLIRMHNGLYALLAHLKQGSVCVAAGDYVQPSRQLAECGNSGRSPQPHLHLHIQSGEMLGSPTYAFHLTAVLLQNGGDAPSRFRLFARPDEGESVMMPKTDTGLADSLNLNVGRRFRYRVRDGAGERVRQLSVALNLAGELRLVSDSGASAAFSCQEHLLACYDRTGPADAFLDAWLLALGLTPFSEGSCAWRDEPSMWLLPMRTGQQLLSRLLRPLGGGLESAYQRQWDGGVWRQYGRHRLTLPGGSCMHATTAATITPRQFCTAIELRSDAGGLQATLLEIGQKADAGIPAWRMATDPESQETREMKQQEET